MKKATTRRKERLRRTKTESTPWRPERGRATGFVCGGCQASEPTQLNCQCLNPASVVAERGCVCLTESVPASRRTILRRHSKRWGARMLDFQIRPAKIWKQWLRELVLSAIWVARRKWLFTPVDGDHHVTVEYIQHYGKLSLPLQHLLQNYTLRLNLEETCVYVI